MSKTRIALCLALIAASCTKASDAPDSNQKSAGVAQDPPEVQAPVSSASTRDPLYPADTTSPATTALDTNAPQGHVVPGSAGAEHGTPSESAFDRARDAVGTTDTPVGKPAEPPAPAVSAAQALTEPDQRFAQSAYSAGMLEIESSQWALPRFAEERDRELARTLIGDHTKANQELAMIASRHGLQIERLLLPEHQLMLDQLRTASAQEVVGAFQLLQLQTHRELVKLLETASRMADDADLKAFAGRMLPTLRKNLAHFEGGLDDKEDAGEGVEDLGKDGGVPPGNG